MGVAQEAHLKKLRRIAAEVEDAVRGARAVHLLRLRRIAAAEAEQREGVSVRALLFIHQCSHMIKLCMQVKIWNAAR